MGGSATWQGDTRELLVKGNGIGVGHAGDKVGQAQQPGIVILRGLVARTEKLLGDEPDHHLAAG